MQRILKLASVALAVLMVILTADTAGADSTSAARRKREELRVRRAKIAAQLNTLKASDDELERAVSALDAQVKGQQAATHAAEQALQAARTALSAAEERLAATEHQLVTLRKAVVDRAVAAYVRPEVGLFAELASSTDLGEASRRESMLQQVANHDSKVVDELREIREDQMEQRGALEQARQLADGRARQVRARLDELKRARADKARLEAALDSRIREFQVKADEIARNEASLNTLIRQREEQARASRGGAFIDDGGRVSGSGLRWPVSGRVTSEYGYRWGRLHAGIDVAAPTGTPIVAAKSGEVIFAGSMSGYGNTIVVDHGGGFTTLYAHQSRLAAGDGQGVSTGQVIGYVGSTGHSTGPHLHFETRVSGSPQNPRRYLP